jgi:hypothetical protein
LSKQSDNRGTGAPLTIASSERLSGSSALVGYHVDQPTAGTWDGDLVVSGWVFAAHAAGLRVIARADRTHLGRVRANRPRPDIATAFPNHTEAGSSGFKLRIAASQVVASAAVELAAEVDDDEIPFWVIRFETALPESPRGGRRRRRLGRKRVSRVDADVPASTARQPGGSPDDFHVIALISTYNEEDIIGPVLDHLTENGISSYLLDDNSTDETIAHAETRLGAGLLGIEQLERAPGGRTAWQSILDRKVDLSRELGADWYMHHDADEIREGPWPGMNLREAIRHVDRMGFNAVGFRVLDFPPVDDVFRAGHDPRAHFSRWGEPTDHKAYQRTCWKAEESAISLSDGGHDVHFQDRRVFPLSFLIRHYPVRGQTHGSRKVRERADRFVADELARGWHGQYRGVQSANHSFLHNPAPLRAFDLDHVRLETVLSDGRRAVEAGRGASVEQARIKGVLDRATPTAISGWAARDDGTAGLSVDIWDGSTLLASVVADRPREDGDKLGVENGRAGFYLRTPPELLDGRPHWVWATAEGFALSSTPLVLSASTRPVATVPGAEAEPATVA